MKKHTFGLVFFLVILTAAAGAAWYYGHPFRRRYSARSLHAALSSYKAEQVAKIRISWRDVHSTMRLENGRWILEERGGRPASVPRISALLNSLATLAPVKELRNPAPEILRELRLVDSDPKLIPGVRVVLSDAAGKELFNLLLGKGHFVRPEPGLPPSPDAEGRYVLTGGRVYLIPVVFENCHPVPSAWVEPLRLYELRKALRMSVLRFEQDRAKMVWSVFRKSTAHPFTLVYPAGKTAENQLLSGLADHLSKPFTMDYFTEEKDQKLVRKQRLNIHCADGFTYVLDLFEGKGTDDVVALQIRYDARRVIRFPGETDLQYRQRCEQLRKRFDFENGYCAGQYFKTTRELSRLLDIIPEKIK